MSRRGRGSRNDGEVRGPRSALTSFLREKGIRARNVVPAYQAQQEPLEFERVNGTNATRDSDEDLVEDIDGEVEGVDERARAGSAAGTSRDTTAVQSDAVETSSNVGGEQSAAATKKRTAEELRIEVKPAKKGKVDKGKAEKAKKKKDDSSDSDEGNPLSPFNVPKKALSIRKPDPHSIVAFCTKCRRRFARSLPGTLDSSGIDDLCGACLAVSSGDAAKAALARRRKNAKKAMGSKEELFVSSHDGIRYPPPLKSLCIRLIADNIDMVVGFGDISSESKVRLAEILSKERKLSDDNLPLFLDSNEEQVRLFDCTKVTEKGLRMIPAYAQNLGTLELGYCGHLIDSVLDLMTEKCRNLRYVSIRGAYLVSDAAWGRMLVAKRKQLKRFAIEDSPRIGQEAIDCLVYGAPVDEEGDPPSTPTEVPLAELKLNRCQLLDSKALQRLAELRAKGLTTLGLSNAGPADIKPEDFSAVVTRLGANIAELDISFNAAAEDPVLESIGTACKRLRVLNLTQLTNVTAEGLKVLFGRLTAPLSTLRMSRLPPEAVSMDVLEIIMRNSASSLTELSLNGADSLIRPLFSTPMPKLRSLDVSWVRCVDDFVLKSLVEEGLAPAIQEVKVFGCNKITEIGARRLWKSEVGGVVNILGSEFD
ncbi:hypothetical protein DFJ74DRAFT_399134 [Hyaloraphidium curvatum]|nr:hypothetical protein DFJ74DRAFT_399134 [Hyaloraphidium curvatum]